jgi:hypothetical protein
MLYAVDVEMIIMKKYNNNNNKWENAKVILNYFL